MRDLSSRLSERKIESWRSPSRAEMETIRFEIETNKKELTSA